MFWPTGPGGPNDRGLGRKHIIESCNASLERLQTDYVDLYQAHRFDRTVPLEETFLAFSDLVRQGKVLYIGVSEWTAEQITRGAAIARELKVPFISNQPQYSVLWRVIEDQVVPACEREGLSQIVWSPIAQGVLTGKYKPGQDAPSGSRATDAAAPSSRSARSCATTCCEPSRGCGRSPTRWACPWRSSPWRGCCRTTTWPRRSSGASRPEQVAENVKAAGVRLEPEVMTKIDEALGDVVVTDPRLTQQV